MLKRAEYEMCKPTCSVDSMFVTLARDTCSSPRTRDRMAMRVWSDLMPTFMGGPWVNVNYTKFVTHDKAFKSIGTGACFFPKS